MKAKSALVSLAALLSFAAIVALGGVANAALCTSESYDNYLAPGFSCTIGNQTYSNFSFVSTATGTGTAATANEITVLPDSLAPASSSGLEFSTAAITVFGTGSVDVTLDFTVTALIGALDDAFLVIAGSVTGDGIISVGETLSNGVILMASIPGTPTDHVTFDPTGQLDVVKDAIAFGLTGLTSLSAIRQDFSQRIPEPTGIALLGIGLVLAGFGWSKRRFRRR